MNSKKQVIKGIVWMALLMIGQCCIEVTTPHLFVRVVTLLPIVACSVAIGAFIRELILITKSEPIDKELKDQEN